MSATSSDPAETSRPKLNLLNLPQEIKDRIFGFIVEDRYRIFSSIREDPPILRILRILRGDDFSHLSILRVSKRVNREVMQVLQMKSWFTCTLPSWINHAIAFQVTPTQHMMNIELIIGEYCSWKAIRQVIDLGFAGTEILRRTCLILIPEFSRILAKGPIKSDSDHEALRRYFRDIKLLTGFATVVVQVDSNLKIKKRGVIPDDLRATMLRNMIEFSEPALGPAVPCDSVRERYDVNFKFCPRRFVAEKIARAELGVGNEEHMRDR